MKKIISTSLVLLSFLFHSKVQAVIVPHEVHDNYKSIVSSKVYNEKNVLYTGKIYHIFFHSLIVYPHLAFTDATTREGYKNWMITKDEFNKILPELYNNNFVLIDITSLYSIDNDGKVSKKDIYLPQGKKPLIISLDDLGYYPSLVGHGFADKLVFDAHGKVATEVVTPDGKKIITRDGDVVPILDDFVTMHPDFSINGAKGIIAVTGYHGILGYRTNNPNSLTYSLDIQSAKNIADALKATGWRFASHSYAHDTTFKTGSITLKKLQEDSILWNKEVRPLVGGTDIFIGPFGMIFHSQDIRRKYLISLGFKMFCGVGLDLYSYYSLDSVMMNRADVDGYRLTKTPSLLKNYFNYKNVIDPVRKMYTQN